MSEDGSPLGLGFSMGLPFWFEESQVVVCSPKVGLLAAVRAAPPKQSGKIAAGVLCAPLWRG